MAMIHGGTAFNIIPDAATIAGTFRAFSKKSFYALRERIEEVNGLMYLTNDLWHKCLSVA